MQHSRLFLYSMLGLMLLNLPATWTSAAPPELVADIEGISEYRLPNGLRLLLFPDESRPTVTVAMTVFVGSRHEGAGEGGMAHLLEHMVFKGTPDHPQIPKVLQERGARFNGTTSFDRTNYYETLPANGDNLEFALRLEADRLVNSTIKGEDLASEMTVVRNEFERSENSPSRVLQQRMLAAAYEWHAYGRPTIGNRSDIERVPLPNLRAFYRKYYQPDNVMVVIAGKFDVKQALALTQETFGAIPKPKRVLRPTYTIEPAQDGERTVMLRRVGDLGLVGSLYHIPPASHEQFAAVSLLSDILGSAPSGRLYKALVETKLAAGVGGGALPGHDPGVMGFTAQVRDTSQMDQVQEVLLRIIEEVGRTGVTEEELNRARQRILKQRELSAADTSRVAVSLSNWAAQGDWRLYFLYRDRIEAVTTDGIQEAAKSYLQQSNRTVGVFVPTEAPARVAIPAAPDVAALVKDYRGRDDVAAGEAFEATPENIDRRTKWIKLLDDVPAALLSKKTRGEAVQINVVLRFGDENSLKPHVTAAPLMPELMTQGTRQLSRQQIQDTLDKHFASLSASGGPGRASFRIQTKRAEIPAVLALLKQILQEPTFPAAEFEVMQRQQLAFLERVKTDPQYLASTRLRRVLDPYPEDDVRYNPTLDEQIARIERTKRDDVERVYRELVGPRGEVSVVGDFDPDEIVPLLRDAIAGLKSTQPFERIASLPFMDVKGQAVTIETPDKANATYYAGMSLPFGDGHADYPAVVLANNILGSSGLSSRLGDRIRQQDGLSYSVRSSLSSSSRDPRSLFTVYAISNPDNSPKVVNAVREEIDRLVKDGVTEDELKRAQSGYLQRRQVSRTNDASLAGLLVDALYNGRKMKFHGELDAAISKLTTQQVREAAAKHFQTKRLVVVTAGDFK